MHTLKKLIALTAGAVIALCASMTADAASYKYDYNMDGVSDGDDLQALGDYLLGRDTLEKDAYDSGDLNGDGKVNVFDLILMRQYNEEFGQKAPKGMWIGSGYDGVRYFWWNGDSSLFCPASSGVSTDFTFTQEGSSLDLTMSTGGTASAKIKWLSDKSFQLDWAGTGTETFTYYGSYKINTTYDISGKYATSGKYGERWFVIDKLTGDHRKAGSADRTYFSYFFDSGKLVLVYRDGSVSKCGFTRIDRDHFTVTWPNKATEKFTRRAVEVKNGITYVNGILIANKTYALPESYAPGGLTQETAAAYNEMKAAATADGIPMWICSGYRSYSYQSQLYNNYAARDGKAKADTYSARPGHSEHQTGLAMDINYADDSFLGTPTADWLAKNCWKYGFIIRYPKGKESITGYKYEPWHVRYLGKETAKLVYDSGLCLEEYLMISSKYSQ